MEDKCDISIMVQENTKDPREGEEEGEHHKRMSMTTEKLDLEQEELGLKSRAKSLKHPFQGNKQIQELVENRKMKLADTVKTEEKVEFCAQTDQNTILGPSMRLIETRESMQQPRPEEPVQPVEEFRIQNSADLTYIEDHMQMESVVEDDENPLES